MQTRLSEQVVEPSWESVLSEQVVEPSWERVFSRGGGRDKTTPWLTTTRQEWKADTEWVSVAFAASTLSTDSGEHPSCLLSRISMSQF